ncbi:MAG TPA: 50S ribosomal protein L4 [Gaiellaceae bacterium]|nr:50S ribosomal protein L4 [Gaiellaceae bacterium]HET8651208.1 50S ribosomal protein L4 [Gaiellaceae bacterium]
MASPKAPLLDVSGKKSKDVTLEEGTFGADVKPHLVHETVRAELASDRAGTRAVKSRGLVAGGRGKPWRQKGTGRARAGTTRAPHWTGGGAAFQPRTSFGVKVNKKARKAAFRAALSAHAKEGTLAFVDGDVFGEPSTKQAAGLLEGWGQQAPVLVIVTEEEEALIKSFRNLERVLVITPADVEVAALVWARALLVTEGAREALERRGAA